MNANPQHPNPQHPNPPDSNPPDSNQVRIVEPQTPSWSRWKVLRRTQTSLLRSLMHERLASIELRGPLLDVGGGANVDYASLLNSTDYFSANLTVAAQPSVLTDVTRGLPYRGGSFRSVLAMNTFEHLADGPATIRECARVLVESGEFHALTPFLWRVHGHPDDYYRYTASAWAAMLTAAGFRDIVIEPLAWDPFATAWAIADMAPLGRNWWRARRLLRMCVLARPLIFGRVDKRQRGRAGAITGEYALAFYVRATKSEFVDS